MKCSKQQNRSRREFLRVAAGGAALGPFFLFRRLPRAGESTLKIVRWSHFLPEYDRWFEKEFVKAWSIRQNTHVTIDTVPVEKIAAVAAAEVAGKHEHDLYMFPWPPAEYRRHAIDHTEVYMMVAARHGNLNRIAHKSTLDPATKKYFAFADSWMPTPFHYLEDCWSEVGIPFGPGHYDGLKSGAKRIREKRGIPCGLALGCNLEGNITLHTLLSAFHSQVLNANNNVAINNYRTIVALRYVKDLATNAGTPSEVAWQPAENVKAMLAGKTSCTMNAINLVRSAEEANPLTARRIMIAPPLVGVAGSMAIPFVTSCSLIWNWAQNKEGAKQFLSDFVDEFGVAYDRSRGCSFPVFQNTVPNLIRRLESDPAADPPYKYTRLNDALHWTPNLGFPGYANPISMEAFNTFVIPRMFLSVVKGQATPEDAARTAAAEVKRISEKWRQVG
ncbi:MAG TPA: carbohydrate ABC transporter substrate-binding protein [Blastocatellia bacterium]|nr:carbohydrate ABC transporter substrate-binding protein [Blastocatellia bacterium]